MLYHEKYRSSRQFLDRATADGFDTFRVPMPIDWDFARRELAGELSPSYTNGDLIYGVNNGGKFSVDVTWLADAEATGERPRRNPAPRQRHRTRRRRTVGRAHRPSRDRRYRPRA